MGEHPFISQGSASGEGVWIGRKRYRGNRILVAWLAVGEARCEKIGALRSVRRKVRRIVLKREEKREAGNEVMARKLSDDLY